jgi:hypothetical protein
MYFHRRAASLRAKKLRVHWWNVSRATPNVELQQENTRLQNDCKRLLAMLETTSEYQHWMSRRAALRGVHYIPIAECIAEEGITSDVYSPNGDRVVRRLRAHHSCTAGLVWHSIPSRGSPLAYRASHPGRL